MKKLVLVFLLIFSIRSYSNINYIQFNKIDNYENYSKQFDFLKNNFQYFNHWTQNWIYEINKDSLKADLKEIFELFSKFDSQNIEIKLLLGDISHYLYNLEVNEYDNIAEKYYFSAIELSAKDYRGYWFLANHYALSNKQEPSIKYYIKALKLLSKDEPAAFWEEYAFSTAIANMPSHCMYAMDKAKKILGKPSYFESELGGTIKNRITKLRSDTLFNYKDLWSFSKRRYLSFVSRPLGIKLLIDSLWQVGFNDYKNFQTVLTLEPPALKNENGKEIIYSLAIIMKVSKPGDSLDGFINKYISKYPKKNRINFSNHYPNMLSYEIIDNTMYQNMGGGHMNIIGIQRDKPEYPGLLFELPMKLPDGTESELAVYRASNCPDRFEGKIFYAIILDVCEDIYPEANRLFKEFFENQIIIE